MKRRQKLRWLPWAAAIMIGGFGAVMPARSDCLSPSVEAGATTTTVYPCTEGDAAGKQPLIVIDPKKTTEVERGSANLPWFEPKPTKTEDPIATSKALPGKAAPSGKKEDVARTSPPAAKTDKPEAAAKEQPPVAEIAPPAIETDKSEAVDTEAPPVAAAKLKKAKPKPAMAKPAKVKLAKTKRTKSKLAKRKATTKTAKAQKPQQPVKTEPAKADEKVVVWTRKDMSLGSRVVNWLGF